MVKLGVNIDHVATLREARKTRVPDPIEAARICEKAGCDSIVAHLREDRRHIKDDDMVALRKSVKTLLNMEMSIAGDIVAFACKLKPDQATLVPERRQEVTTEGGLDVKGNFSRVKKAVSKLEDRGIRVSLFINPVRHQIDASISAGARIIELHTGEYANALSAASAKRELTIIRDATAYALTRGLEVNAGHGLDYNNVKDIAKIKGMHELNIGHSIISRSIFFGLYASVIEMKGIIR
ncbi:MAG TPA: pyridoxine 5'-phosphate synthase [Candidatus Omnitrophota bacterium]|nr:pyridoxine 5'-phosphate synthase [Candidatus Omnitrophota bacterium]